MKLICRKVKRYTLAGAGVVMTLILLDIIIAQSIYHPLIYVYQGINFLSCQITPISTCQKKSERQKVIAEGKQVVVSSQHQATQAGIQILKQGGNAIDAAVAIGYALAVVDPCCGNLGGGGFMVIRTAEGKETFINFREKAPLAADGDLYKDKPKNASTKGYLAVGVPGSVKGLEYARQNYGTLSRETVMAPAVKLAEKGFILRLGDVNMMKRNRSKFQDDNVQKIFLKKGKVYQEGERLKQPELAQTLRLISQKGEEVFYRGEMAQKIVKASQNNGGILSLDDFAQYEVDERPALSCQYQDYRVVTAPPPGGGIPLCQMLMILEMRSLEQISSSSQYWHQILSAMLFAYADRNAYLGDPNFVSIPIDKLLSPNYAKQLSEKIPKKQAINPKTVYKTLADSEGNHTTHYSVIDSQGNAVAVTTTINSNFGAGVIAQDTGFFLNNEMDDFTTQLNAPNQFGLVQGQANLIEPGKRPLSSMTPTIVVKDNRSVLITGSPGGPTITTTVLQVLLNYFHQKSDDIVNHPKLHYQGIPSVVFSEPYALSSETFHELWQMGYKVIPLPTWGAAETIVCDPTQNSCQGIHDSRKSQGKASAF